MKTLAQISTLVLGLAALASFGCHHRIIAAMPAPMPPRPVSDSQSQAAQAPPVMLAPLDPVSPSELPPPDLPPPPPSPPAPAPARPRSGSAEADASKPNAEGAPAPPLIVPALSQKDMANAMRITINDESAAQKTLVRAASRHLNPSQSDLAAKIKGFLDQTDDAKKANDWVRAENLAQKAQILAFELMKSL